MARTARPRVGRWLAVGAVALAVALAAVSAGDGNSGGPGARAAAALAPGSAEAIGARKNGSITAFNQRHAESFPGGGAAGPGVRNVADWGDDT